MWHFHVHTPVYHMCRADYVTLQYAESVVKKYAEAQIPLEVFGTLKDAWQNKWVPHPLSTHSSISCARSSTQVKCCHRYCCIYWIKFRLLTGESSDLQNLRH